MITLKKLRKVRKNLWTWQIVLGDVIALLQGPNTYARRWVRKKAHKLSGSNINKFRKMRKSK